jgi:hypothetical protein
VYPYCSIGYTFCVIRLPGPNHRRHLLPPKCRILESWPNTA